MGYLWGVRPWGITPRRINGVPACRTLMGMNGASDHRACVGHQGINGASLGHQILGFSGVSDPGASLGHQILGH